MFRRHRDKNLGFMKGLVPTFRTYFNILVKLQGHQERSRSLKSTWIPKLQNSSNFWNHNLHNLFLALSERSQLINKYETCSQYLSNYWLIQRSSAQVHNNSKHSRQHAWQLDLNRICNFFWILHLLGKTSQLWHWSRATSVNTGCNTPLVSTF